MIHRWNKRPFTISIDLAAERGQLIDCDGNPVDCVTVPAGCPDGECVTLELDCESTGYYDAGRIWGLPENCYPPEGEDERHVVSATLVFSPQWRIPITDRQTLNALAERFAELIENAAVNTSAPEPEYEHD